MINEPLPGVQGRVGECRIAPGRGQRRQGGLPWQFLPAQLAAWGDRAFAETALNAWEWFVDHPETVTSTVQDVTGAPARSFAGWAAANAAAFR